MRQLFIFCYFLSLCACARFQSPAAETLIVDSKHQKLSLYRQNHLVKHYKIGTSVKGLGQRLHSFQTPRGQHFVKEKIGQKVPTYGIFKNRVFQGEVWQAHKPSHQNKDFIIARILRLEGLEPGINRGVDAEGHSVDTFERVIYIHGSTQAAQMGVPHTRGCIHLAAKDMVALFNEVSVGTRVIIH